MSASFGQKVISIVVISSIISSSVRPIIVTQGPFEIQLPTSQIKNYNYTLESNVYDSLFKDYIEEFKENTVEESDSRKDKVVNYDKPNDLPTEDMVVDKKRCFLGDFRLTAYTLSEDDCGKAPSSPLFGIASSGYDFKGKDLRCRKIAVDPRVIEMGTTVYIEFTKEYNIVTLPDGTSVELSGYYQAVDTGGAIKGNRVDLFVGGNEKDMEELSNNIGVRYVKVYN